MREPLHGKGPVNDGRKGILRRNMIVLALIVVLLVLGFALRAKATPAPILEKIVVKRGLTNHARKVRCLTPLHRVYVPAFRVPISNRPSNLVKETNRLRRALAKAKRCLPTSSTGIIRYVFPDATEDAALRVAYCESRLYTYARNPSGASGLFQLMPFHWVGRFDPFDPWANTRYSLRLSDGGWNWGPWVCKP